MNTYKRYKTDATAVEEGMPVEFAEGLTIRVRSMRSKVVRDANARIAKRNQRFYRTGSPVPLDIQDADNIELTGAIIAGWAGATDENGKALEYSPSAVRKLMTDLPELRDQVIAAAGMSETFRDAEDVAAATENLSSASAAGSSSAAPGAQGS